MIRGDRGIFLAAQLLVMSFCAWSCLCVFMSFWDEVSEQPRNSILPWQNQHQPDSSSLSVPSVDDAWRVLSDEPAFHQPLPSTPMFVRGAGASSATTSVQSAAEPRVRIEVFQRGDSTAVRDQALVIGLIVGSCFGGGLKGPLLIALLGVALLWLFRQYDRKNKPNSFSQGGGSSQKNNSWYDGSSRKKPSVAIVTL